MKIFVQAIFLLVWLYAYLATSYRLAMYRKHRAFGLAAPDHPYRAEKDMGLSLIMFAAGSLLCLLAFWGSWAIARLF